MPARQDLPVEVHREVAVHHHQRVLVRQHLRVHRHLSLLRPALRLQEVNRSQPVHHIARQGAFHHRLAKVQVPAHHSQLKYELLYDS